MISRAGRVSQYALHDDDGDGRVEARRVRLWSLSSEAEGCVADDARRLLYIGEEDVALWRYGAQPDAGTSPSDRVAVDRTTAGGGRLAADIEGLAIADTPDGGYLIASAQAGSNTANYYAVYRRQGDNGFVGTFTVQAGSATDRCGRTDGIAAYAGALGPRFPRGLFVCQDHKNEAPGTSGNQNFKLVPLERVVPGTAP
jgi:3-phytase